MKKIKIKKSKVWEKVFIFLLAVGVIAGTLFNYLIKKEKTLSALDNCLSCLKASQSLNNKPVLDAQLIKLEMDNSALKNLQSILKTENRRAPFLKNLTLRKYKLLIQEIEKIRNSCSIPLLIKGEKNLIEKSVGFDDFLKVTGVNKTKMANLYLQKGGGTSLKIFLNQQKFFYLKRLGELVPLTGKPCWEVERKIKALNREVQRTPEEKALLARMRFPQILKVYTQEAKRGILLDETKIILTSLINNVK